MLATIHPRLRTDLIVSRQELPEAVAYVVNATTIGRFVRFKEIEYFIARQLDVYVIQILSQEEIEPEIMGDLKLVDVEDDDVAELTVNGPLLKRYKQNLAAYCTGLHDFCTRRGVSCLFTSNQVPFDRLVLTYLRQRGLVR